MYINERQVALRKGGNYNTIDKFFDRKKIVQLPFSESQSFTAISDINGFLINNLSAGIISTLGRLSLYTNGAIVASIGSFTPGVGSPGLEYETDDYGNIINMIQIRDAITHDPILNDNGMKIYGLLQCSSNTVDGDSVSIVPGSENLQISFIVNNSGLELATIKSGTNIEFQINKLYSERYMSEFSLVGGIDGVDVIADKHKDFIYVEDSNPGIEVNPKENGTLWINYLSSQIYICKDNSVDNNIWIPVNHDIITTGSVNPGGSITLAELDLNIYSQFDFSLSVTDGINRGSLKLSALLDNTDLSTTEYIFLGSIEDYEFSVSRVSDLLLCNIHNSGANMLNCTLRCNIF